MYVILTSFIPFFSEVIEFTGVIIIAAGVYNLVIRNKFKFDSLEIE